MLDLQHNPEHAKQAAEFLRGLTHAELSQGIASPWAFVDRLPGFTRNHVGTKDGQAIIQLAKDEQQRRRDTETRRMAIAALLVSGLALIVAVWAELTP